MNSIRYWRRERQISQEDLSMATGIPRYRLSLIERQNVYPSEREVRLFSSVLRVSREKLVDKNQPHQLEMDFETGEIK